MESWKLLLVAASILFSGCTTQPKIDWSNPTETQNRVQVEYDDFEKTIKYRGPNVGNSHDTVFIRAWGDLKNNSFTYQIYVSVYYLGDWRFYRTAYDSDGNNLDTTLILRDVERCRHYGCWLYEHVGLNISREYLENYSASGVRFKSYSQIWCMGRLDQAAV